MDINPEIPESPIPEPELPPTPDPLPLIMPKTYEVETNERERDVGLSSQH